MHRVLMQWLYVFAIMSKCTLPLVYDKPLHVARLMQKLYIVNLLTNL